MRWDRPGEGRRGQAGEQGSAWDKKTRPPWAPLYRSVSLAPQTGRPASMNGSLDGTSETLSHHRNFSLFFLVHPHPPSQLTLPTLLFRVFQLMWARLCPDKLSHKTTIKHEQNSIKHAEGCISSTEILRVWTKRCKHSVTSWLHNQCAAHKKPRLGPKIWFELH